MEKSCDGKCDLCAESDSCTDNRRLLFEQERRLKANMRKIKHKLVVISGKGGVGKSTVTANLAIALAKSGFKVGVLDADIHGPSIPKMLGVRGETLISGPPGVFPVFGPLGIRIVSMDFLLEDDVPVIWRGPLKMTAIRQFLSDIMWGELDILLVDLPPGTGDEPLSVIQLIPEMDGAIIVTIPSEVSQIVVKKAVNFARQLNVSVVGIVENMSGFICPRCGAEVDIFKKGGGRKIAEDLGVPFLGSIPIDPTICADSDSGVSFTIAHKNSLAAKAFIGIVDHIQEFLKTSSKVAGST
ncbi:MAG: Mrp/NBP35 family ATP-binding protein [Nitrososphaerota archaeon]